MKTSELTGAALNRAVHTALQYEAIHEGCTAPPYSTDWAFGGPIIEREKIATSPLPANSWRAYAPMGTRVLNGREIFSWEHKGNGPTPLIAAMRCFVSSKLGDNIDIPEELL